MLDAAALAAILDPGKVFSNWWEWDRKADSIDESSVRYIGPPDLHTAREHAWRMEDWMVKHGYQIVMRKDKTIVWESGKKWHETSKTWSSPNHTAALVAAIERISNG